MPFATKHDKIVSKVKKVNIVGLWLKALLFGGIIFALVLGYSLLAREGELGNRLLGNVAANTGMVMIGISFMLSGLTFFWDFVDTKILYRKHIGLVGFYLILAHVVLKLDFYFAKPKIALGTSLSVISFMIALFALFIFILMTAISNRYSVKELGGKAWRKLLRLGYVAYFFAVIHFGIEKLDHWEEWINQKPISFPPFSLLLVIFGFLVFGLRIALEIAVRKKRSKAANNEELGTKDEEVESDGT
ncbi:MAG TPA: hypothetical protein ENI23_11600 [bacterium]|nr:hypothetical protein [bacterium]